MATSWAQVDAAAMVPIDDERLNEQLEISPALYYRRMSMYVKAAIPMLSKPPELLAHITGEMQEPSYGEYEWTSTDDSMLGDTVVQTGMTGYELCSCVICEMLNDGRILQTPYAVTYDAETGDVTFPQQTAAGIMYQLDFYTDGSFADLTETQMRLFAQAIAVVWDQRFTSNWLDRTPKIMDSSFMTVNEANWTEKTSQAHMRKELQFWDELQKYEQLCAYQTVVASSGWARGGARLV